MTGAYNLLGWVEEPRSDCAIHFSAGPDGWSVFTYEQLAEASVSVAGALVDIGVRRNDVVTLMLRSGRDFTISLYGTLCAGATASPVAPPTLFSKADEYARNVSRIIDISGSSIIICDEGTYPEVARIAASKVGVRPVLLDLLESAGSTAIEQHADLALLQFTSGSTSSPRGVRVPFDALAANIGGIIEWLVPKPGEASAHWLPFYHDMGLIGGLMTPITGQTELWNLRPGDFVRDPLRYLRCFGIQGVNVGTMPNFGLEQVLARVSADQLEGMNFSAWRSLIAGSERLNPAVFEDFGRLLSPFGFRRSALMPAYGLAESTLAVTGLAMSEEPRYARVDHGVIDRVTDSSSEGMASAVVGCGTPILGMNVAVIDEDGRETPAGTVGEIFVAGSSVAAGYQTAPGEDAVSLTRFCEGGLRTGDAGFLLDGQLFVLGRLGDSMKVRGRALFAEDLELMLADLGLPSFSVAVLLGYVNGRGTVVAVLEDINVDVQKQVAELLRQRTEGADVHIVNGPFLTIARTTSGKPRRRMMWRDFTEGRLSSVTGSGLAYEKPVTAGQYGGQG